jgi:hypothetical protein
METRCEACYQPATKKCTSCGKVFCDLHVRYGAQTGGMYGRVGEVGYYCDACWERQARKRKNMVVVLAAVGILVLGVNMLGFFAVKGSSSVGDGPAWIAATIVGLLVFVGMAALKNRR